jgi:hypothetical protein
MLLRRSASVDARFAGPGVVKGLTELVVWKEERLTEERPASARLVPEEERGKRG